MPAIPVAAENPSLFNPGAMVRQIRDLGGYRWLSTWQLYQVTGADAATYLQTQTCNDVLNLANGCGQVNALVDRKAHWQALFLLYRDHSQYWILAEAPQGETLLNHLDAFHFIEDVAFASQPTSRILWVTGQAAPRFLTPLWGSPVTRQDLQLQRQTGPSPDGMLMTCSLLTAELSWLLVVPEAQYPQIQAALASQSLIAIDDATWELMRIEAGYPQYGVDVTSENLLPETGLEHWAVNYNKGCYLGQEVVARIKTYGVVPKALIGLVFEDEDYPPFDSPIAIAGKTVGQIKSGIYSPACQRGVAMAYLHRDYRLPGNTLTFAVAGQTYHATLKTLPFYQAVTPSEHAQRLYEEALSVFTGSTEAEAIPLLEEALAWNPALTDAYEVLGVILSRQGQHQEAISVMTRLTEIAPTESMAYTNLSVFYMRLGQREEAEKHMAKAAQLNMLKQQQAQLVQVQAQNQLAAKQQYIAMFKEVLETEDPDDLVANYGLGKIYFDLQHYEAAIPYLEKAVAVDRFYSAAYLALGKALEASLQMPQALAVYQQGIVAASQKGDLMPMKEMEQRVLALS